MSKNVAININDFISRLEGQTASIAALVPNGFQAKCPIHDDQEKSLSILEHPINGYEIACEAGCSTNAIMEFLGYPCVKQHKAIKPFLYESPKSTTGVRVVGLKELLVMELPNKEIILSPFLTTQGIALVYAKRGVGKTHLSLGIAYAIASGGSFLKWNAPKPNRVLFVDGEMPAADLRNRLQMISLASDIPIISDEYFQIISPDLQIDSLPDLSSLEGREIINNLIDTFDVIILDNLSSLFRSSIENEADSWQEIQDWLLELRRKGKSIIIIHHAGKSGQQRGTSKREDVADTVICLKHPDGYKPTQGACFEVHFEKTRHFAGEDAESFTAKMVTDDDGLCYWSTSSSKTDTEIDQVVEGIKAGLTIEQICAKTGLTKSQVETRKQKAKNSGLIQ